jgi:hypothetical protein
VLESRFVPLFSSERPLFKTVLEPGVVRSVSRSDRSRNSLLVTCDHFKARLLVIQKGIYVQFDVRSLLLLQNKHNACNGQLKIS